MMRKEIHNEIKKYLLESSWCDYSSGNKIKRIIEDFKKKNTGIADDDKSVLKSIAEETRSGTLIKVKILHHKTGVILKIVIYGANGEDIYFQRDTYLKNAFNAETITSLLKVWLKEYRWLIPYDGKILNVFQEQFISDVKADSGVSVGDEVEIVRLKAKKGRLWSREILGWDTELIAKAQINKKSYIQSLGTILFKEPGKRVQVGDWVIIKKLNRKNKSKEIRSSLKNKKHTRIGLGTASLFFTVGTGAVTSISESGTTKEISGYPVGFSLGTEIWLTRKYWGGLDISQKWSTYEGGTYNSTSNSTGAYKLKFGYRYPTKKFVYERYINIFSGFGRYSYSVKNQPLDNFVATMFQGILLGINGHLPVRISGNKLKVFFVLDMILDLDIFLWQKYWEQYSIFGEVKSISSISFTFGASYLYRRNLWLDISYERSSNSATFDTPGISSQFVEGDIKLGVTYNY